jgi:hypothetical protein
MEDCKEPAREGHVSRIPKRRARWVRRHHEVETQHPHEARALPKIDERGLSALPSTDLGAGHSQRLGDARLAEPRRQAGGARISTEGANETIPPASAQVDEALPGRHGSSLADGLLLAGYPRIIAGCSASEHTDRNSAGEARIEGDLLSC